jgi:hypothetical protein
MIFAMEKSLLIAGGKTPEEAFAGSADTVKDLPKGTRSQVYDDGKFYGRQVFFDNVPFAEFNGGDGTAPAFSHADGRYTFTMDADMSGAAFGQNTAALKPFLDSVSVKVSVKFPGKVIERDNLAQLEGEDTVTWDLKMGSSHKLKAVSEEPATARWLLLAGVIALFGLLAVGGIVVLALRLNRGSRSAAAAVVPEQVQPDHGDLGVSRTPPD